MNMTTADLNEIALGVAKNIIDEYNNCEGLDLFDFSDHLEDVLKEGLEGRIMQGKELEEQEAASIADAIKERLGIIFNFAQVTIDVKGACIALRKPRPERPRKLRATEPWAPLKIREHSGSPSSRVRAHPGRFLAVAHISR